MKEISGFWFEDVPVIGKMPEEERIRKLEEIGDFEAAESIRERLRAGQRHGTGDAGQKAGSPPSRTKGEGPLSSPSAANPYENTAHTFGYISPGRGGADQGGMKEIRHAGDIDPDSSLKSSRVVVTLDRMRVADYPGLGEHKILFDFFAQNQVQDNVEYIHFSQTFRAQEGQQVGLIGYPIFIGLNVGLQGLGFKCYTVNVENKDDEAILRFLDNDIFKNGLKLATTLQPAIAPLSSLAFNLTKMLAERNRNVPVQDFYMGLDFSTIATRAKLAEGSYVAVQIPETSVSTWNWSRWAYNQTSGQIVDRLSPEKLVPYNYIVFGLSRYEGP